MKKLGYRWQRTIARYVELTGVGFVTGATVRIGFRRAPPDTGIVFVRTDLKPAVQIPAHVSHVSSTRRCTTLGQAPGSVALVEHVLATLSAMRIDNCFVELNAAEPPGLDGSALDFLIAIERAGIIQQQKRRSIWTVSDPLIVADDEGNLALYPAEQDELKVSYLLDYGAGAPLDRQRHTEIVTPQNFANDLARSRTFILDSERAEVQRLCAGTRATTADLLVFGPRGPIDNALRFANEPARHKVLDILGDLALFGADLRGHVVGYRSGHRLNFQLAQALWQELQQTQKKCRQPSLAA